MSDELQPLFAVLVQNARPLGAALQAQPTPPIASSWLPPAASKQVQIDDGSAAKHAAEMIAAKAAAVEAGRAEGLAETAALREQLATLAAELTAAKQANTTKLAETIAQCAIAAIEGFIETAPKQELFTPVVEAWIVRAGTAQATAKVHPSGVVALQAAIGDAPIAIEADPAMQPGDIKIRGEALDTNVAWAARLRDLRDVIATALEQP